MTLHHPQRSAHHLLVVLLSLSMAGAAFADAQADLEHARKLSEGKRFKQAYEAYAKAIPHLEGEEKYKAMYERGYAAQRSSKRQEALDQYAQVIDAPDAPQVFALKSMVQSGYLYALLDQPEKARELYARVDATEGIDPELKAETRLRNAYSYGKSDEQREMCYDALMRVLDVEDGHFVTHQAALNAAGNIRQEKGRYEEAIELYERSAAMGEKTGYGEVAINRLVECRHAAEAEVEFFIDPYVTLTGSDKASIFWIAAADSTAGSVKLTAQQPASGDAPIEQSAELLTMVDQPYVRQRVDFTGLKPYTLYAYTATCGDKTRTGVFRTHRVEPGPTRFVVIGDTQTGWQHHEKLGPLIAADNPEFVLHVGDCVEKGNRWDEWKVQLFDPGRPYLQKAPLWIARGNHDGGPYFVRLMGLEEQPYQSFTSGDLRVVVLDSHNYFGRGRGEAQLAFLDEALKKKDTQWVVTTQHHPMYHTALGDKVRGGDNYRPVFEANPPDLIFNGHYHTYCRFLPIGTPGEKPLINITTGGGGGRMGNLTRSAIAEIEETGPHHYCLIEIDGNRLTLTAKGIDGSIIDTFELIKTDGVFQSEVMEKIITPEQVTKTHMALQRLEKQQYKKSQLSGSYDAAAKTLTIDRNILKPEELPADTSIVIEGLPDSPWKIQRQQVSLSTPGPLTFKAVAPAGDEPSTAIPDPQIKVTLQIADQPLIPKPYVVLLNADASANLTSY